MSAAKEIQWVQSSQAGNREAFAQLVDRYRGTVTGVAYSVLGDFARSEDAGQEAFLEAWQKISSLADPAKFAPWICTIVRRRAIDLIRKQKPSVSLTALDSPSQSNTDSSAPVIAAEEKAIVWQTVDGLPQTYRETLVLFYRGEQSVREVAQALGENEATIRQRLKRGRDLLRSEISETVERTLKGTVPSPAFVLAVMGAIPGSLKTASAATAAAGSASTGKAMAAAVGAAKAGTLFGMFGGLAGGLIGMGMSWKYAKFQSQRKLIVKSSLVFLALTGCFLIGLSGLVRGHFGIALGTQRYAIALMALIFGYQILGLVWYFWITFAWKKAARRSTEAGKAPLAMAAQREAISRDLGEKHFTSDAQLWGLPLVDVQFWSKRSIEEQGSVPKSANAWFAMGNRAYGRLFACGQVAIAPVAMGQFAAGLISFGLLSFGLISIGTIALGGLALGAAAVGHIGYGGVAICGYASGGIAIGYCAIGGIALAIQAAKGGIAWSMQYAQGGVVLGQVAEKTEAAQFFEQHWFFGLMDPMMTGEFPTWVTVTFWIGISILFIALMVVRRCQRSVMDLDLTSKQQAK